MDSYEASEFLKEFFVDKTRPCEYLGDCPETGGNPEFPRGYLLYKWLQVLEQEKIKNKDKAKS